MKKLLFVFLFSLALFGNLISQCDPTDFTTWAGEDKEICLGEEVIIGCDPVAGYCYKWVPEAGLNEPLSSTPIARPDFSTIYTLFISDDNGNYIGSDQVVVTVHEIVVEAGDDIEICTGSEITLTTSAFGASTLFYEWSTGEDSHSITVSPQETTQYQVTVSNSFGCSASDAVSVEVVPQLDVTISPQEAILCPGSTLEIGVSLETGHEYLWNDTGSSTSNSIMVSEPGTYSVTVTDVESGCTGTDEIVVGDPASVDEIFDFFASKGFYSIPITIGDFPGVAPPSPGEEERQLAGTLCDSDDCDALGSTACVHDDAQLEFLVDGVVGASNWVVILKQEVEDNLLYFPDCNGLRS